MKSNNNKKQGYASKGNLSDGVDAEFSYELADHDDLEALQRSQKADARAASKKQQ